MRFLETNSTLEFLLFKPDYVDFRTWKVILLTICSFVIVFTVIGNLLTLVAALKMKQFHNSVSNLYIASLAAADLIVGSFIMTFRVLHTVVYELEWTFGLWLCDVWQILDFTCCSISLYSICAIAFDRWFNLQKPLRIFKRSRKFARKSIIFIWLVPLIITVIAFCTIGERTKNTDQCCFTWRSMTLVPLFVIPIFYIPVLVLLVVFLRIAYVIRNHLHFLQKHANSDANRKLSRKVGQEPTTIITSNTQRYVKEFGYSNSYCSKPYKALQHKSSSPSILFNSHLDVSAIPDDAAISHLVNLSYSNTYSKSYSKCKSEPHTPIAPRRLSKHDRNRISGSCDVPQDAVPEDIEMPLANHEGRSSIPNGTTPIANGSLSLSNGRLSLDKTLHAAASTPIFSIDDDDDPTPISPPVQMVPPPGRYRRGRKTSRQHSTTSTPPILSAASRRRPVVPIVRAKTETALLARKSGTADRFDADVATITRKFSSNLFSEILPNATYGIAQQVRAARAVGVIMICFLTCWIPFIVVWPMKVTCPDCVSDRVYDCAIWANYLNSTINPVVYALCSPRFQVAIRRFLCIDHKPLRSFQSARNRSGTKV